MLADFTLMLLTDFLHVVVFGQFVSLANISVNIVPIKLTVVTLKLSTKP